MTLGKVFVETQHDRGALKMRQTKEERAKFVVGIRWRRSGHRLSGGALEMSPAYLLFPMVTPAEVDHRLAQITGERFGRSAIGEPAHYLDEGLLREVLGQRPVSRHQVGDGDRSGHVKRVEVTVGVSVPAYSRLSPLDRRSIHAI